MTLGGDLYLPGAGHAVPALVTLHTARKDAAGGIGTRRYLQYFARRGYATLYVDCFGVGTSEGVPRPMLDPAEVDDGVSVVNWAAEQPWSTGKVGMWGYSHGGMTTLAVASRRPPHLEAIFPIMGLTDLERDLVHPAGLRGGIGMFGQLGVFDVLCALLPLLRDSDRQEYENLWRERLDLFVPWIVDAWKHGPGSEIWRSRSIDPSQIAVPSLCVAGWNDPFCSAMFSAYEQIRAPKRLIVGPWLHMFPDSSRVEPVNSMSLACAWWDRWLADEENPASSAAEEPAIYIRGDRARWVQTAQWPPAQAGTLTLRAATGGRLIQEPSGPVADCGIPGEEAGLHVVTHSADPTVGALNGLSRVPVNCLGYPPDQHEDDNRSVVFTSAPLSAPVLLTGRACVTLLLDPASTASQCSMRITDVDQRGRSTIITTGLLNLSGQAPAEVSGPRVESTYMTPTAYSVPPGHRIRLALAGAEFPGLWPNERLAELSILVSDVLPGGTRAALHKLATHVTLPLSDPAEFADTTFLAPARDQKHRARRELPPHRWEITRDLHRQDVKTTIEMFEGGTHMPDKDNFVQLDYLIQAAVERCSPASAWISTSAQKSAELESGSLAVARAEIQVSRSAASLLAQLSIDGAVVFAKEWKMRSPGMVETYLITSICNER
jgi:putative CocE/NonD family hydrolase